MTEIPRIKDNTPEEEAEIQRQIAEDAELAETPLNATAIKRGRPFGQTKQQVTIRLDGDLLAALKSPSEKGWQTRANSLLRKAMGI